MDIRLSHTIGPLSDRLAGADNLTFEAVRRAFGLAFRRIGARAVTSFMRDAGAAAGVARRRRRRGDRGPLRIVTGELARAVTGAGFKATPSLGSDRGRGAVRSFRVLGRGRFRAEHRITIPQGVHEKGFAGPVAVAAHARRGRAGSVHSVRAHVRVSSTPARPFIGPAVRRERRSVARLVEKELARRL